MTQAASATAMPRQMDVFASGVGIAVDVGERMLGDSLAKIYPPSRIPVVNVASVPQRSPLRKARLQRGTPCHEKLPPQSVAGTGHYSRGNLYMTA